MLDRDSTTTWLVAPGRATARIRPGITPSQTKEKFREFTVPRMPAMQFDTTTPIRSGYSVRYPEMLDPVEMLKMAHGTDMFLVVTLSTQGTYDGF